jgi:uncharacterized protein
VDVVAAPVHAQDRAAAPDLARGAALLGIAVANSVVHLYGRVVGPSARPVEATAADRATDVLAALLVDNRGYPLFAFLLGYGTWQLAARQSRAGVPASRTRAVLVRRGLALLAFGAVHAALLFSGDILGLYGVLALLLAAVTAARDRSLLLGAAVCLLPFTLLGVFDAVVLPGAAHQAAAAPGYLASVGARLGDWLASLAATPLLGVGVLAPMLLGLLAARRRLLDEPARHRRLLARVAAGGVATGVAGGVPLALTSTGRWDPATSVDVLVGCVHALSGLAGALGYAALAALASQRPGPVRRALVACGRRSLSCYLAQSVLLVPLFVPWGLGLGARVGTAAAAGIAVGAWALTVAWAAALERSGRRGPAERALRRLVYGRRQPTERQGSARSAAT